jgi:hypothetical protein
MLASSEGRIMGLYAVMLVGGRETLRFIQFFDSRLTGGGDFITLLRKSYLLLEARVFEIPICYLSL